MTTKNNDSTWTKSTCAYCGVGCGIEAKVNANGTLEVRGDKDHPANYGKLCSKGLKLGETVTPNGRMLSPSVHGEDCAWDDALSHVANTFKNTIAEHGPDAVAFYVSGQLLTEDYYVVNKLMKGFIGTANIDTNSRLCMASSVVGHKRAFGEDCVPGNYEDLELANLVVLTGSNLAWCHPVLYQRLKAAKARRGTKIVVIDHAKPPPVKSLTFICRFFPALTLPFSTDCWPIWQNAVRLTKAISTTTQSDSGVPLTPPGALPTSTLSR